MPLTRTDWFLIYGLALSCAAPLAIVSTWVWPI